ncbi:hypothetical protein OCJ37_19795 [Xanthomonas sp. AM6]|uniref:hypothetical protein n=1 Tax=Xanthomonas sp. AM6 TaxID=2982531 RepID=UPI0021D9A427|nr:hypothetical protein [Xanthomonas sp. AM6]UYB52177.1 hypothetical protein OCJ37_19795 [Xanthomonas sp. AM6]
MDIATRTNEAIAQAVKRLEPASAARVNELNVKFDRLVKQGLVTEDSYGIAVGWVGVAQAPTYKR